jgi:RNA 2',3'-cyclic 3'-phosphodiesterase
MLRLFVGIALPEDLRNRISLMASGVPGAHWVDPGTYHVTVRFIGEVDEGVASDIDEALLRLRAKRFEVSLAGVGHFGARTLWVGVERNEALVALHGKIDAALIRLGLEPERRRYAPHVTLARLKGAIDERLTTYLAEHALFRAPPFRVAHFSLVASYLTKAGAIYEDQAEYALAPG